MKQLKNHLKSKGHPVVNSKRVQALANTHHLAAGGGGGIHLPSLLQTIKSTKSEEELEASMKGVLALMGVRWTYEKDHAVPIYDRKVSTSKTLIYFTLLFKNKLCGTCGIHCAVCFRHCHMIQYWNVSCRRRAVFCTS